MLYELPFPKSKAYRAKGVFVPTKGEDKIGVFLPGESDLLQDALYHLDAARDTVETAGINVTQVTDQKENTYLVTGASGQIEYGPHTSPTGRRVYRFTSGDRRLGRADALLPQPFTAYVVYRVLSTAVGHALFDSAPGGPTSWFVRNAGGARLNAGVDLVNPVAFDAAWCVTDLVADAGNSVVGHNGNRVSGQAGVNGLEPITIGDIASGGQGFFGELAELAILPGAYDERSRDLVVSYLTRKWTT